MARSAASLVPRNELVGDVVEVLADVMRLRADAQVSLLKYRF
jgi:hypothetical protein